jgi:hypothetical protein
MTCDFSARNLIFLISQPRAGSTMLQRILAGHPDVHATTEPWLLLHPIYALRGGGHQAEYDSGAAHQGLHAFLSTLEGGSDHYLEALRYMALHLYGAACARAGKPHFLDKTPRYFLIIPELAQVFPEARFIILLRNPLAVLSSILNTWIRGDWIRLYRHHSNLLLAPGLLLDGIDRLGGRAAVVRYEDLVREPESQVAALCEGLGLGFDHNMLEYGGQAGLAGRMGDKAGVHLHTRPALASLDRWTELGRTAQTCHFAREYLAALGSELVGRLGYDYAQLDAWLAQVPGDGGKPKVTWQQAMVRSKTTREQLAILLAQLAQQRRPAHAARQLVRLLQGHYT